MALATMSELVANQLVANLTNSKAGSGKRQAELVQNSETVLEACEDETKGWGWGRGFEFVSSRDPGKALLQGYAWSNADTERD